PEDAPIGLIPVDALFSPVRKVAYKVDNTRVGQVTDYDKLSMRLETNGAVTPEDAVALAARILQDQLQLFINFDEPQHATEAARRAVLRAVLGAFGRAERGASSCVTETAAASSTAPRATARPCSPTWRSRCSSTSRSRPPCPRPRSCGRSSRS